MLYSKINLSKLYEQSSQSKTGKGKLFAFPIDSAINAQLEDIITKGSGEWKSTTPLNLMGIDGSIGGAANIKGKPVYLWISVAPSRKGQTRLELEDRSYVILDTTAKNLKALLSDVEGKDNRKRAFVKDQEGSEFSIELWINSSTGVESTEEENVEPVGVDLETAQEFPGTAPVTGTVAESTVNEQGDAKFDIMQKQKNKEILDKPAKVAKTPFDNLNDSQKEVIKALGKSSSNNIKKRNDGTYYVYAKVPNIGTAFYFSNDRVMLRKLDGTKLMGSYANGGKSIKFDNGKTITKDSPWNVLKGVTKSPSNGTASNVKSVPSTGFDQPAGDAFRKWANSTPDLKKKYGKESKFDLDPKGKPDNSFIRKAYAAAKEEYSKYLSSAKEGQNKPESKYKEGQVIYYKVSKKGEATDVKVEDSDTTSAYKPSAREIALAKSNESIVTKFEDYVSIVEEDEVDSTQVDQQMTLIKDLKSGKIKKGIIRKIVSKDDLKVEDLDTENIEVIKASDIVNSKNVKIAKEKIKQQPEDTEKKIDKESKLEKEKGDTKSLKKELKDLKKSKRDLKKSKRKDKSSTRKIKRQDKKQSKLDKKISKQQKKIESIGESRFYTFNEFLRKN
jgi:hypothetical protein